MTKPDSFQTITIPASTAELARVRRAVKAWCREAKLPRRRVRALLHAVDETVANAIEHGVGEENSQSISITPVQSNDALSVIVTYEGAAFNPLNVDFNTREALRMRRVHGYGLALCRRMVNDIRYHYRDGVNEVTFVVPIR